MRNLIVGHRRSETELEILLLVIRSLEHALGLYGAELAAGITLKSEAYAECLNAVSVCLGTCKHVAHASYLKVEVVERTDCLTVDGYDAVSLSHTHVLSKHSGHYAVNASLNKRSHERRHRLEHLQQIEVAGHFHSHLLAATQNVSLTCSSQIAEHISTETLEVALVSSYEDVAVVESESLSLLAELHTKLHVLGLHIVVAPSEEAHGIDEESEKEVDQYATYHNKEALPSRLRTKLPRLCGLSHLFLVERFVYHARYLAVAAERHPANAVACFAVLRFELEEVEPGVEEQIELLHSYAEELGEEEVSALMQ